VIAGWVTLVAILITTLVTLVALYRAGRYPYTYMRPVRVPKLADDITFSAGSDYVGYV
jgi:hypothetical protein